MTVRGKTKPRKAAARVRKTTEPALKPALRLAPSDVTERRRMEEAVKASEARYHALFTNTDNGVAVYTAVDDGADFVFADLNEAGGRIDAIIPKNAIGRRVTEVFPGVREFGLLDVLGRVWRTGTPVPSKLT